MFERAREVMPLGVASSYHARDPWPIYLERGEGARVWDVDGNELLGLPQRLRLDGAGPRAPGDRRGDRASASALGTHFAAPTEDGIVVAEELARRFGLPQVALHELRLRGDDGRDPDRARAHGRDTIMKIFGSYHGHHDAVMVSIGVEYDRIGDRDDLAVAAVRRRRSRRRSPT